MKVIASVVDPPSFKPVELLITFEAQWEVDAFVTLINTAKSDTFKDIDKQLYAFQSIDEFNPFL